VCVLRPGLEILVLSSQVSTLGKCIALGGEALNAGGRIVYLGEGTPGLVGVIDASECPPTFGAKFDDVRGFVVGGLDAMSIGGGHAIVGNHTTRDLLLDVAGACDSILPKLTRIDLLVIIRLPSTDVSSC
jgi:N-acetylmuramic acid 6-phosphate etherase